MSDLERGESAADDGVTGGAAGSASEQPRGPAYDVGRRRAAGIYGAIVTAAIFAATSGLSTASLVVAVVVTLVVYWLAEEYADLLGEQIEDGRLPSLPRIGHALAETWPMVTASFLPLAAAVVARLAGASSLTAANIGLAAVVLLLGAHSWAAARAAHLTGWRLAGATATAVALGVVMVLLKNLVLLHLH
ncbi:hypothetical protein ABIA31_001366 [Catenulispora sp. MAP5-51]|uniref:hypothetical protein n=1 Tax=Catenulispora sp. MAP5-51 TaxID=3156298 RepID=UPI0035150C4B